MAWSYVRICEMKLCLQALTKYLSVSHTAFPLSVPECLRIAYAAFPHDVTPASWR